MIQKIINDGKYQFIGTIDNLKKCISSFRITKTICDEEVCGVYLLEVLGKFKYHGIWHRIKISKDWTGKDILYIEYQGGNDSKEKYK